MEQTSILVQGAGELGSRVIEHLAGRLPDRTDVALTVLLRPSTIDSEEGQRLGLAPLTGQRVHQQRSHPLGHLRTH